MRARSTVVLAFALACGLPALTARAQGFGVSQELETSIRAAGMGGATTAVTWGEPGVWGNPASLSGTRGIAWLEGRTKRIVGLVPDARFDTRRFLAGGAGFGLSLMGDPARDLGRARLDYGSEYGTDPIGNPTGPWDIGERVHAWGVGVSPLRLLDELRALRSPGATPLVRRLDLGFGYQHKRTRVVLAPGAVSEAENFDWGVNGRFAVLPGDAEGRRTRLEFGAGFAELNADEGSTFDLGTLGNAGPSTRMRRVGVAARAVLPFGAHTDDEGTPWSWWPAAVPNAMEVGLAFDRERRDAGGAGRREESDHWGLEASFMGILTGRTGYVRDPSDDIRDWAFGLGLRAPIGPWASLGYDWAHVPRGGGLARLDRHGWFAWLHPGAIWRTWGERR
jgi:hypothetical protein